MGHLLQINLQLVTIASFKRGSSSLRMGQTSLWVMITDIVSTTTRAIPYPLKRGYLWRSTTSPFQHRQDLLSGVEYDDFCCLILREEKSKIPGSEIWVVHSYYYHILNQNRQSGLKTHNQATASSLSKSKGTAKNRNISVKEESKSSIQSDLHYCTVGPLTDYKELLAHKGYEVSGETCKVHFKGMPNQPIPKMSQESYEELGDLVQGWIRQTMREYFGLKELWIGGTGNSPKCNIYVSEDFTTNKKKCMVFIQGNGPCRPGVWARSVCINDGIVLGSMFTQLEHARTHGYSVIVLNPNFAVDPISRAIVPHCQSMAEHCNYVWENFISCKSQNQGKCAADKISIWAHSAGGRCVANMFSRYKEELLQRTEALVLIDAYYHDMFKQAWTKQQLARVSQIGVHYRNTKSQPGAELGKKLKTQRGPITELSAGATEHCYTCPSSGALALDFMESRFSQL